MLAIDLDQRSKDAGTPDIQEFERWATVALQNHSSENTTEVSILIVDQVEMQALNKEWRQQDKVTNILSFPANIAPIDNVLHLGDIVICSAVIESEAQQQQKDSLAHWAHIFIHGMLHLQNYDHISEEEANIMEALEINLLAQLNIANPYLEKNAGSNAEKNATQNTKEKTQPSN